MNHHEICNADLGLDQKKNQLMTSVMVALLHGLGLWAVSTVKVPELHIPATTAINVSFVKAETPAEQPVKPQPQPEVVQPRPKPIEPVKTEKPVIAVKNSQTPKQVQQPQVVPEKPVPPAPEQPAPPPVSNVTATPEAKVQPQASTAQQSAPTPQVKYVDFSNEGVQWKTEPKVTFDDSELRGANRTLLVQIEANEKGQITAVKVLQSSGVAFVDAKVLRAVRAAKLKPYLENGVAYAVKAKQLFNFKLS